MSIDTKERRRNNWSCLVLTGGGSSSLSGSPLKKPDLPGPKPPRPGRGPIPRPGTFPKGPMGSKRAPGGTAPLLYMLALLWNIQGALLRFTLVKAVDLQRHLMMGRGVVVDL